jgi:hypothetical protein
MIEIGLNDNVELFNRLYNVLTKPIYVRDAIEYIMNSPCLPPGIHQHTRENIQYTIDFSGPTGPPSSILNSGIILPWNDGRNPYYM